MQFSPISSQFTIIMLDTEWPKSISMSHKSYPHHCNAPKPSIGFRFCLPSHWTTAHPFMDGSHVTPITIIRLPSYHHHFKRQPTVAAQWQLIIVITAHITTTHDSPHSSWYIRCCPPCISIVLCLIIGNKNWNRNPTPRNKVSSLLPSSALTINMAPELAGEQHIRCIEDVPYNLYITRNVNWMSSPFTFASPTRISPLLISTLLTPPLMEIIAHSLSQWIRRIITWHVDVLESCIMC